MKHELELEIQAYVDGELSGSEARRIAAVLKEDPEAGYLAEALVAARSALQAGELERPLPETREFFWSKIEREIARFESSAPSTAPAASGLGSWWLRWGTSAAVIILGVALVVPVLKQAGVSEARTRHLQEIETPVDEGDEITFHSESARMTVVWVQTRFN